MRQEWTTVERARAWPCSGAPIWPAVRSLPSGVLRSVRSKLLIESFCFTNVRACSLGVADLQGSASSSAWISSSSIHSTLPAWMSYIRRRTSTRHRSCTTPGVCTRASRTDGSSHIVISPVVGFLLLAADSGNADHIAVDFVQERIRKPGKDNAPEFSQWGSAPRVCADLAPYASHLCSKTASYLLADLSILRLCLQKCLARAG